MTQVISRRLTLVAVLLVALATQLVSSCKSMVDAGSSQSAVKYQFITALGAPRGRSNPGVNWTGAQLIVWGGQSKTITGDGSRGGVWSSQRKAWRTVTSADAPHNRYQHSSVWTGDNLIIWGGISVSGGETYLADGGIYNPEYDSWDDSLRAEIIKGRAGHSAVWTGAEMIVWGGFDDTQEFADGAIYNPKTRKWRALPTENAPSARSSHLAGWTGSKMIIFGGKNDNKEIANGGIYDTETGKWSKMARPGQLIEATSGMSTSWVDDHLVVWGGEVDGMPVGTGAVWNPETNEWSEMASSGAPSPRSLHLAVSTGKQLIVFGGRNDIAYTDGAVYSPADNKWMDRFKIRNRDIVATQRGQTAVWADGKMIIWGIDKNADLESEMTASTSSKPKSGTDSILAIYLSNKVE